MRTFEFRMSDDQDLETVSHQFQGDDLTVDELLYKFLKFLRASDYCFAVDDRLELVKFEDQS